MIQGLVQFRTGFFQRFKVDDEAGVRLRLAAYSNFSTERMPVQRAIFLSAGGKDYEFIPCLNERGTGIQALMMIALGNPHGWLPVAWDAVRAKQGADRSLALTSAMGAKR